MIQIRNFINGQWQEETGGKTVPLYNPSTGETIGSVPVSNMETCEAAIATAAEAYKTWRLVPIAKRMTYIHKIRECMIRDLEKLAQGIALDQAKHISEARGEVQRVIEIVEMACSIPALIQGETLDQIAGSITGKVTKQSLGVFGGVAPFNFPALVFGWFIPFAIGTGNTFIYKPSTQSPYFMQLMCEIFMEIGLPGGVVNVIHGSRDIPGTWYEDPRIAGVCLVGSTPTAKKMAEGCARGAKRSMLLGGAKNMLVVMEDADIDVFIENYINSCYGSAGQRCLAGSIVAIVPELYDTVLERMIEAAKKVKVGDALDPDVYMGPADAHVDADHAHVGVAAEFFGIELALREDAHAVAEFGLPDEFEGVVDVRDFDRGDQRAEHFSREQRVAGGHVLDDRGADEIAVLVLFGQFGVAAVEDEFAAVSVVQGDIHVFLHLRQRPSLPTHPNRALRRTRRARKTAPGSSPRGRLAFSSFISLPLPG